MPKEACQTKSVLLKIHLSADVQKGQPLLVGFRGDSYNSVILGHLCLYGPVFRGVWGGSRVPGAPGEPLQLVILA